MAFKLKSGNRTSFKMMGSSPVNLGWKKFGMDPSDIEATGEKSGDSPVELNLYKKYQKGKKFLKKLLGYETKKPIDKTKEAVNWDFEEIKKALKSQFEERR